jgi:bifunctional DNA-binding transcriptional regulator/antitoxin component of YhaV-PrlF toxin-antitoxin module
LKTSILLDCRDAVLRYCAMTTLTLNKRGGITLPPDMRRRMGLDHLEHPLLIVEERDGGVFLHPAKALPVRDIPAGTIQSWIHEDDAAMEALRKPAGKARSRT